MKLAEINSLVEAVCPIHGINSNGDISFKDEATASQKSAAKKMLEDNMSLLGMDSPTDVLRQQIKDLEAQQTPRRLRDAILTQEGDVWLSDIDAQISALRAKL